jgi:hypothetical protein
MKSAKAPAYLGESEVSAQNMAWQAEQEGTKYNAEADGLQVTEIGISVL